MKKRWQYENQVNVKDHLLWTLFNKRMDESIDPWLLPMWNEVMCAEIVFHKGVGDEAHEHRIRLKMEFDIIDIHEFLHQLDITFTSAKHEMICDEREFYITRKWLPFNGCIWMNDGSWWIVEVYQLEYVVSSDWVKHKRPEIPKDLL